MTSLAPILEFDGIRWGNEAPLRFDVEEGACIVVRVDQDDVGRAAAVGRLACGLDRPPHGTVRYHGHEWERMTPAEAERCRGTIGRVFSGTAWISNLNVGENVLLATLHHTRRPVAELRTEAERLSRAFGLDALPDIRPARVAARDLQRAQWVRAWLNQPDLLILELPDRGAGLDGRAALVAAVAEARARGVGVLWISTDTSPPFSDARSRTMVCSSVSSPTEGRPSEIEARIPTP